MKNLQFLSNSHETLSKLLPNVVTILTKFCEITMKIVDFFTNAQILDVSDFFASDFRSVWMLVTALVQRPLENQWPIFNFFVLWNPDWTFAICKFISEYQVLKIAAVNKVLFFEGHGQSKCPVCNFKLQFLYCKWVKNMAKYKEDYPPVSGYAKTYPCVELAAISATLKVLSIPYPILRNIECKIILTKSFKRT